MKESISRCSLIVLFLFGILFSCTYNDKKKIYDAVREIDPELDMNEVKVILVIPNGGCSGCINNAIKFLKESIDEYEGIKFIMTQFVSIKSLRLSMGGNYFYAHDKVIIDQKDIFLKKGIHSIYPFAIFLNKGRIKKVMYGDPESSAIFYSEIKTYLLTAN